jgi:hypothetical protein
VAASSLLVRLFRAGRWAVCCCGLTARKTAEGLAGANVQVVDGAGVDASARWPAFDYHRGNLRRRDDTVAKP